MALHLSETPGQPNRGRFTKQGAPHHALNQIREALNPVSRSAHKDFPKLDYVVSILIDRYSNRKKGHKMSSGFMISADRVTDFILSTGPSNIPCLTVVVVIILAFIVPSWLAGLGQIPGPWLAKYTNLWSVHSCYRMTSARSSAAVSGFSQQLQQRDGSTTVRTGPQSVIILDPRAVRDVYGFRARLDKVCLVLHEVEHDS